jgi:hypothetical protein
LYWLTAGDSKDDAGMLDLEPTEAAMACHRFQDWGVSVGQLQRVRLTSTHSAPLTPDQGHTPSIPPQLNLLHDFCPTPLEYDLGYLGYWSEILRYM